MTRTFPTRLPDGTTHDLEYLTLEEVVQIIPVHITTARKKLAAGEWHGARFGRRWWMTRDDVADAVADARGEGTYRLSDLPPPRQLLGAAVDDDGLADIGDVR